VVAGGWKIGTGGNGSKASQPFPTTKQLDFSRSDIDLAF
jgi:hypothetical protein